MKKKVVLLAVLSSGLLLSGCGNISHIESKPSEETSKSEILSKDDKHLDLMPIYNGKKFAEDAAQFNFPDKVRIHYHRDDNNYKEKRVWLWSKTGAPEKEFELVEEEDTWSRLFEFSPAELFNSRTDDSFSFMIKDAGTWAGKSSEMPILYKDHQPQKQEDGTYALDLYVTQLGSNLTVYDTKEDALSDQIDIAFISETYDKINVYTRDGTGNGSSLLKDIRIYKFNEAFCALTEETQQVIKNDYLIFSAYDVNKDKLAVKFDQKLTINSKYLIEATFQDKPEMLATYIIGFDNLYNTKEFSELTYQGNDLGAHFNEDKTAINFKVWAPTAFGMKLKIYETSSDKTFLPKETYNDPIAQSKAQRYIPYTMHLNLETACWEVTVPYDKVGAKDIYYTYEVTNGVGTNDVVDPYAYSAGIKGQRGMVVDFDSTKATPEGWNDLPLKWDGTERDIKTPQELAISEVHVRDLTCNPSWGGTPEKKGTFNGFIESGTTYTKDNVTVKTGYDHLVEYGVNAIQLLPVFDQDNGERGYEDVAFDPEKPEELTRVTDYSQLAEFNWGYNPLNYNVVEGAYSSDPTDGYVRVKEFRNLVQTFATNENQTRIIMDVVYNHVSSAPTSNFERLMPKYYYRFTSDGGYSDAAGCGNEVKTEAPMMRKFIVDSLCHWARHYKIKGFRFDLMGVIDLETLSVAADELYKIDPDIVLYGEGWYAGAPTYPDPLLAKTENLLANLGPNREGRKGFVGGFNDGGRDSLKGHHNNPKGDDWKGYILGTNSELDKVKQLMLGKNNYSGSKANHPMLNIAYASCHDNYTLFDHLNYGLSDQVHEPKIQDVATVSAAVNGMILMSNCASFINGGEEIFRTKIETRPKEELTPQDLGYEFEMFGKRISHNSYKSSDETNSFDYSRKVDCLEQFNMYKQLVQLKKNLAYSQELVDNRNTKSGDAINIEQDNTKGGVIGIYRKGNNGKAYHVYLTTGNGGSFNCKGKIIFQTGGFKTTQTGVSSDTGRNLVIVEE